MKFKNVPYKQMSDIDADNCQITHYPAEVLRAPAEPIEEIDDNIRRLAEKMIEIMLETKGIGLAGPQAGVNLRIFVISLDGTKENVKVYINPTITVGGELEGFEEGCLSVPGVYTKIRRYKKCSVTATDLQGNEFTEEAEGLYARCLQHENDHLEGVTIADKMGAAARIANRRKLKELMQKHEANRET